MSTFLVTMFGIGKKALEDADKTLTKELVAANPERALRAELDKRKAVLADWRDRLIEAKAALARDEKETRQAKTAMEAHADNLRALKNKMADAQAAGDTNLVARITSLAKAERVKYDRAAALHEREMQEDAAKHATVEKVQAGYDKAQATVDALADQMDAALNHLRQAKADQDIAHMNQALDAELATLEDPLAKSNVAIAAINDTIADYEKDVERVEMIQRERGLAPDDHDAELRALLNGDDNAKPADPFAGL